MSEKTLNDWQVAATALKIDGQAFINGRRCSSSSGETRPTLNPANGEALTNVAYCNAEDANTAIATSRATFESGVLSRMAPTDRKMILVRWAELIEKHSDEIALLETLDVGKPISDTLNVDVGSAVRTIRWSGDAIDKIYDEITTTSSE